MRAASAKLEPEYIEYLQQLSREISVKERRTVTISDLIRTALQRVYPMEKVDARNQMD